MKHWHSVFSNLLKRNQDTSIRKTLSNVVKNIFRNRKELGLTLADGLVAFPQTGR